MKPRVLFALCSIWFMASCAKDDNRVNNPPNQNDEELITSLLVELSAGGASQTYAFRDPDGPGGNDPVQWDTLRLQAGVSAQVRLSFLDESKDTTEDITLEIMDEAEDHQVFFTPQGVSISITVTDTDSNGNLLGLESSWTASSAGTGTLTITLKHQPEIKAAAPGDIALGETDVEVIFPIRVD